MKREFLQNLKVGDQALPKEIIDAIMDENGKDIEAAKKPFADYEAIKEQLNTAKEGLKAFDGIDIANLQNEIKRLNGELEKKDADWQAKFDESEFQQQIERGAADAKAKNAKTVIPLLDMDALRSSKNRAADIAAAFEAVKKDNAYLFDAGSPGKYAPGTGTQNMQTDTSKMTYTELCAYMAANPGAEI